MRCAGPLAVITMLLAAHAAGAEETQWAVHPDGVRRETPVVRSIDSLGFDSSEPLGSLSGPARRLILRGGPSGVGTALVAQDDGGVVTLRLNTSGSWDTPFIVDATSSTAHVENIDAAWEQTSGELVIAYARQGSTLVHFRTFHGDQQGAPKAYDIGFTTEPQRVSLRPHSASDRMILVASDGLSVRASVWDGDRFSQATSLTAGHVPASGFDAAWGAREDAVIAWAEPGGTVLRYRRYESGSWAPTALGPSLGAPIVKVRLGAEIADAQADMIAAVVAGDADATLFGLTWNGSAWSSTAALASSVAADANGFPLAIAHESATDAAVVAWSTADSDRLFMRRLDGGVWQPPHSTTPQGRDIAEVLAAPVSGSSTVAVCMRLVVPTKGKSGAGSGQAVQSIRALIVDSGVPGSTSPLTNTGNDSVDPLPFDLLLPRDSHLPRIVRWTEVSPSDQ